jgi:hypothetical protein
VQMGLFNAHQMEGGGLGAGILIYIVFDIIIGIRS